MVKNPRRSKKYLKNKEKFSQPEDLVQAKAEDPILCPSGPLNLHESNKKALYKTHLRNLKKEKSQPMAAIEKLQKRLERSGNFSKVPFPGMRLDAETKPKRPELLEYVSRAIEAFDLEDEQCCWHVPKTFFKALRQGGGELLWMHLQKYLLAEQPEFKDHEFSPNFDPLLFKHYAKQGYTQTYEAPGRWLFSKLPAKEREMSPIDSIFYVKFDGTDFVVVFPHYDSSVVGKSELYFPNKSVWVRFGEKDFKLGFRWHACDRIYERMRTYKDPTYYQRLLFFITLFADPIDFPDGEALRYESTSLADGEPAVRLLQPLTATNAYNKWEQFYLDRVLGRSQLRPNDSFLTVMGYLPVALEGPYAIAKTYLFPGFSKTPESALLKTGHPPPQLKKRLKKLAGKSDFSWIVLEQEFETIKWFHENGIEQIFKDPDSHQQSGED